MSTPEDLKCPQCGAKIYRTDAQCLSCGARLDAGRLVTAEPGRPPEPVVPAVVTPGAPSPPQPVPAGPPPQSGTGAPPPAGPGFVPPPPGASAPLPGGIAAPGLLDPLGGAANSSGQRGLVPPEVEQLGFNWGGFFLSWIWAIAHSSWIGVAVGFLLGFPIGSIICGVLGNRWAWQNRRFESLAEFQAVQRAWAKWGLIAFIVQIIIGIGLAVFVAGMLISYIHHTAGMIQQLQQFD